MPKTSRSSLKWLVPAALLSALMGLGIACGSSDSGEGGATGCTPGAQSSCPCPEGGQGVQQCNSDGASFGTCDCGVGSGNGTGTASTGSGNTACNNDGIVDTGEDCDDGNADNTDGCTQICKAPFCGDGYEQAGEDCDDGNSAEFDACPSDCDLGGGEGGAGGGTTTTGAGGSGGDPCAGVLTYAGLTAAQPVPWVSGAFQGTEAGTALCQAIGADHICEYKELSDAIAAGELNNDATIMAGGVSAWVHRTTLENVDASFHPNAAGTPSMPGAGGRCNDWQYTTNHISDGEYVDLSYDGTKTNGLFWLDNDTFYDGVQTNHQISGMLQCGGTSRRIACCYPTCTP